MNRYDVKNRATETWSMDARKLRVSCIEARRAPKSTDDPDHKSAEGINGIDARIDPCSDGCCVEYNRCEPKMDPGKEKEHWRRHVCHVTSASIAALPPACRIVYAWYEWEREHVLTVCVCICL